MDVSAALKAVRKGAEEVQGQVPGLLVALSHYRGAGAGDGVSLLQAKSATLLRYTLNLVRFAEHRVRGEMPAAALREMLAADWAALEKMRPLEKRLRPQLEALLSAAAAAGPAHRPDPAAMLGASDSEASADDTDAAEGDVGAAYVPPRIAETVYDGDGGRDARRQAREEARRERMRRGAGARAMLAEVAGLPTVIEDPGVRAAAEERRRTKFEEENFMRMTRTKAERKARDRKERAAAGQAVRGEDEISGLIGFADRVVKKGGARQMRAGVDDAESEREAKVRALDRASGDALEELRERRKARKSKALLKGAVGKKKRR